MRRYGLSKLRLLFMVMFVSVTLGVVSAMAQTAPNAPAPAAEAPKSQGLIDLILSHPDFVFFTIAILSVIALTLIIQGFIKNRASVFMPEETTNQIREMISQRKFKELIEFTETDPSFVSKALNPALKRAPSFSSMKEAMETAIGEQSAEQFRKIEYLNIIGNLGPLLGLLGTVLGMIYAFNEVSNAQGQADVGKLSYGISTALTHTFLGLFLAIPCLSAFGILRTMVDRLTVRGALVAEELLLMIKPSEAKPAAVGATRGAVPQPAAPRKSPPMPAPTSST